MNSTISLPWTIKISSYLYDHSLAGKAIYPAAEILVELAGVVRRNFPQAGIDNLTEAFFPRFLTVPANAQSLAVSVQMNAVENNGIAASLLTKVELKTGNISRVLEHGRVKFSSLSGNKVPVPPFSVPEKLPGECIAVPPEAIYRELVPFGKSYRNITGDLTVSRAGAVACLSGGGTGADDDLLGSPFPFDAVLHAACVWGQRFGGVVAFPVGFSGRTIYKKTKKGITYRGQVIPVQSGEKALVFDAWIFDLQGSVCEEIRGIRMQDVNKGRMKPPDWIRATTL